MQLGQAQVVRSNWEDRTPLPYIDKYNFSSAPHGPTQVSVYTVPANRTLKLASYGYRIHRNNPVTASDIIQLTFGIYDDIGALVGEHLDEVQLPNLWDVATSVNPCGIILPSGYEIRVTTLDLSTGGGIRYNFTVAGTLYDA